jgi:Tol biopolymer transport system component
MACLAMALLVTASAIAAGSAPTDPVIEPGKISTAAAEVRVAYRPDGRQVVWGSIGREAAPDQQDIWEIHRTGSGWSAPARASFDTNAVEFDPSFSRDSRHLFFDSDRAGGFGGTDVYVVEVDAVSGRFSSPRNLGEGVNSKGNEWAPTPTARGTLLFSSDGWGGEGKHDLFEANLRHPRTPRNLGPTVNGPDEDFDAALSPDGKKLIFSSGTMSDTADVHLFRSRYTGKGWARRERLALGCSDFVIGAAFALNRPHLLYYSANCPDGRGRMDIHAGRLDSRG